MSEEGTGSARYSVPSRGRVALKATALGSTFVAIFSSFAVFAGLVDFTWDWSAPLEVRARVLLFEVAEGWMYLVPALTILAASVATFFGSMVYLVTHPLPGGDPPDTVYHL